MYIGRISVNSHLSKRKVKMLNDVVCYKCVSNDVTSYKYIYTYSLP